MSAFSVLIDSSVWVEHFRNGNAGLIELLEADCALSHPMVTAELACGTPPSPREQTLRNISLLKPCNQASLREVMTFIEREALYGKGCGLVDICLLASTLITPETKLWTLDKRLADLANQLGAAYQVAIH
ncbi:VapC toxin family PIN domain ribonuclease [Halomonas vilamensis]|uniref:VapC toxin family PIN domain ribonuclease n=1 Tax=Vreelandella vilamensis TaxID=531309 RepID=A0ABU1H0F2_9GAMM|nr:VapC toxin family PIN domain ribonuclease [Halomonas vilamensis]MDR5897795.1 VapC toxin family PIN domain ribonuclease [Halomonas vilamensis]